jgi:hypothetical protein
MTSPEMTAMARGLCTYTLCGFFEKGADYLRTVQDPGGGFRRSGKEGPLSTVHTAVVLDALKAAGYRKRNAMVENAIQWLISCQKAVEYLGRVQQPDGAFVRPLPSGTDKEGLQTTCFVAWALSGL